MAGVPGREPFNRYSGPGHSVATSGALFKPAGLDALMPCRSMTSAMAATTTIPSHTNSARLVNRMVHVFQCQRHDVHNRAVSIENSAEHSRHARGVATHGTRWRAERVGLNWRRQHKAIWAFTL